MANTVYFSPTAAQGAALILFDRTRMLSAHRLGPLTIIGGDAADIRIPGASVSGRIALVNDAYCYQDTDGAAFINGRPIAAGAIMKPLKDGDVLCFSPKNTQSDRVYAMFAQFADLCHRWESLTLSEAVAEVCIGRCAHSDLQFDNAMISEKHASFFCSQGGWAIIDHHSTNGVFLNGKKLNTPRYLEEFDTVRIADSYFIFTGERLLFSACAPEEPVFEPAGDPSRAIHDVFSPSPAAAPHERASVSAPQKRSLSSGSGELKIRIVERSVIQRFRKMLLLQDINLDISNGEMVLILGGSGAGKTTFINAVMGYEKASGTILYRDTDIYEEYEQMKYEIGFVPQQDLLRGSDTVYDTLSNAAEMKLPRRMSYEQREERIRCVLDELGLSRERDTLVSKLSGGQKKRLSIAVEFIADPNLFFLDEPDSGLDDIMGRSLMENLRSIADQGKIVMIITHSPERAAELFDKVIVLAKSTRDNCGHLAFYGPINEAFEFFGASCLRDIVRKINRLDENGEGLSDHFIDKYKSYCEEGTV